VCPLFVYFVAPGRGMRARSPPCPILTPISTYKEDRIRISHSYRNWTVFCQPRCCFLHRAAATAAATLGCSDTSVLRHIGSPVSSKRPILLAPSDRCLQDCDPMYSQPLCSLCSRGTDFRQLLNAVTSTVDRPLGPALVAAPCVRCLSTVACPLCPASVPYSLSSAMRVSARSRNT
jgi:hypothetical protein